MKIAMTLATLLLTATLAAQGTHVYPFAPTTNTPIEVHYLSGCLAGSHAILLDGNDITITIRDPQCVLVLPIPFVEKVKLPPLPAGVYNITINQELDPFFITGTRLVVRNAGMKPFELHPAEVDSSDDDLVHLDGIGCKKADCSDVTVRVDGEPVGVSFTTNGTISFTAPFHESGLVDVSVQQGDVVTTSPAALYYMHEDSSERNLAGVTPILFPVVHTVDGAFGSRWESALTVSNPRPWEVDPEYTLNNVGPCIGPCDPPFGPKFLRTYTHGYPHGTVMWARQSEAADLAFSLRIRDVSQEEQGWGAAVPVVRGHDFIHGKNIHLLDVPLDPRYRVKVRVYMIEPVLAPSPTGVVRFRRGDQLLTMPFTLANAENGLRLVPYYAEVDLPQGAANERVHVEVVMPLDATGWAFASVTNNETQQVTIVAP
ncbi:MAG TPA: IPT/TIG domain-containing protein [Thermoanaerobaculia bacterium]